MTFTSESAHGAFIQSALLIFWLIIFQTFIQIVFHKLPNAQFSACRAFFKPSQFDGQKPSNQKIRHEFIFFLTLQKQLQLRPPPSPPCTDLNGSRHFADRSLLNVRKCVCDLFHLSHVLEFLDVLFVTFFILGSVVQTNNNDNNLQR